VTKGVIREALQIQYRRVKGYVPRRARVGNVCFDALSKWYYFSVFALRGDIVFRDFRARYAKGSLSMSDGGRCEYGYSYDAFYDGGRRRPSDSWTGMEMGKTG